MPAEHPVTVTLKLVPADAFGVKTQPVAVPELVKSEPVRPEIGSDIIKSKDNGSDAVFNGCPADGANEFTAGVERSTVNGVLISPSTLFPAASNSRTVNSPDAARSANAGSAVTEVSPAEMDASVPISAPSR